MDPVEIGYLIVGGVAALLAVAVGLNVLFDRRARQTLAALGAQGGLTHRPPAVVVSSRRSPTLARRPWSRWGSVAGERDGVPIEVMVVEEPRDSTVYFAALSIDVPTFTLTAYPDAGGLERLTIEEERHRLRLGEALDRAYHGTIAPSSDDRAAEVARLEKVLLRPEVTEVLLELARRRQAVGRDVTSTTKAGYADVIVNRSEVLVMVTGTTRPFDEETVALLVRLARAMQAPPRLVGR